MRIPVSTGRLVSSDLMALVQNSAITMLVCSIGQDLRESMSVGCVWWWWFDGWLPVSTQNLSRVNMQCENGSGTCREVRLGRAAVQSIAGYRRPAQVARIACLFASEIGKASQDRRTRGRFGTTARVRRED